MHGVRTEAVRHGGKEVEIAVVGEEMPTRARGQIRTVDLRHEIQSLEQTVAVVNCWPIEIIAGNDGKAPKIAHAPLREAWREDVLDGEARSFSKIDRSFAFRRDRR